MILRPIRKSGFNQVYSANAIVCFGDARSNGRVPEAVLWWLPGNEQIPVDVSDAALQKAEEQMDVYFLCDKANRLGRLSLYESCPHIAEVKISAMHCPNNLQMVYGS